MRRISLIVLLFLIPAALHAAPLVNINTADAALLDTLPGIGPAKAQAIIDYRTKNGPFQAIEDIQNVSGIGPTTFANMKDQITVSESARGGPSPEGQPPAPAPSYKQVQTEPINNATSNIQTYEEAVRAPAVTTELAPAGAPLPPAESRGMSIFKSPWTLGLVGVIILAAGAFIFI